MTVETRETIESRTSRDEIVLGIEQSKAHLAYWAHLESVQDKLPLELQQRIPVMKKLQQSFLDTGLARLAAVDAYERVVPSASEDACDLA